MSNHAFDSVLSNGSNTSDDSENGQASSEATIYLKQYFIVATHDLSLFILIGAFFTLTEETKILGDMLAIPLLLSIIRSVHVGVLFSEGFACIRRLRQESFYFESGLKGALGYPFVVSLIACLVFSALLMFLIPQFKEIFMGMRVELPLATQAILWLSDVMMEWWWLILPVVLGATIFAIKSFSTRSGREKLTPWVLRIPVFGKLYREFLLISFLKQWSGLLKEGLEKGEALRKACLKAGSTADLQIIQECIQSDQILENALESPESQDLRPLLNTYGEARKSFVERRVKFIEVATIIFMGVMIGGIVISIFMPMNCMCNCVGD